MNKLSRTLKSNHIWLIFVFAFIVRLLSLNQSLWLDEGTTARVVQQYSIPQIITSYSPTDFHPPLFYIIEKFWTTVFGYSEIALRMPSVLFSILAGVYVFFIGKKLKDEHVGAWAAAFFLFNPLVMYYSQEARMYAMATCFLAAAMYYFLDFLKKESSRNIVMCNVFMFLSFFTFYGSIFLVIAMYAVLYQQNRARDISKIVSGLGFAILLLSPLLLQQMSHAKDSLALVSNWKSVLGKATIKNLLLFPVKFSIGRISFQPKVLYYLISTIWTVLVFFYGYKGFIKQKYLALLFFTPLIVGIIFSVFSPLLQYFRFIYLLIPLSVALALGTRNETERVCLFAGFWIFSSLYISVPMFHREDWRSLADRIQTSTVYAIPSSMDPLKYYKKNVVVKDIRTADWSEDRITVIPYTTDIYGIDYKVKLRSEGYSYMNGEDFRGVGFEEWRK